MSSLRTVFPAGAIMVLQVNRPHEITQSSLGLVLRIGGAWRDSCSAAMHAIVATLALAASLHAPQRTYVRTTRPNSLRSGAAAALERLRGGDAEAATADGGGSASIEEGPEEWGSAPVARTQGRETEAV